MIAVDATMFNDTVRRAVAFAGVGYVGYQAIFASVLLRAEDGHLWAIGSNHEERLAAGMPVEGVLPGIAIPAKVLAAVAGSLPDGEVSLAVEGLELTIRHPSGRTVLMGLDEADYPADLEPEGEGQRIEVRAEDLADVIGAVQYLPARGRVHGGPPQAIMFVRENDRVVGFAHDLHRLAIRSFEAAAWPSAPLTLPLAAAKRLMSLMERLDAEEVVRLEVGDGCRAGGVDVYPVVWGQVGGDHYKARLYEHEPAVYGKVIPTLDRGIGYRLDRAVLISALRRAHIVVREHTHKVILSLEDHGFVVKSRTEKMGASSIRVEAEPTKATRKPFDVAFNADFLLQNAASLESDEVTLWLMGPDSPARLDAVDATDRLDTRVLMPMQMD